MLWVGVLRTLRHDGSRTDAIDSNPLRAVLQRQNLRQRHDASFGGRVRGKRNAHQGVHRADVDNRSGAPIQHSGNGRSAAQENTFQRNGQDVIPSCFRDVEQEPITSPCRGVIYKNIYGAGNPESALHVGGHRNVTAQWQAFAAHAFDLRGCQPVTRLVEIQRNDASALRREGPRHFSPNAISPARDHRGLARKPFFHFASSLDAGSTILFPSAAAWSGSFACTQPEPMPARLPRGPRADDGPPPRPRRAGASTRPPRWYGRRFPGPCSRCWLPLRG